jgi:hypothetical protein
MLHLWLFPVLAVVVVFVCVLYYVLHRHGGDGVRTEGQCVLNRDGEANAEEKSNLGAKTDYLFIRTPPGNQPIRWTKPGQQNENSNI